MLRHTCKIIRMILKTEVYHFQTEYFFQHAHFYTIKIKKTQVASAGDVLGVHCVVYAAVGAVGKV